MKQHYLHVSVFFFYLTAFFFSILHCKKKVSFHPQKMPWAKRECYKENCKELVPYYESFYSKEQIKQGLKSDGPKKKLPSFYYDIDDVDEIKEAIAQNDFKKCDTLLHSNNYNEIITILYQLSLCCFSYECMEIINKYRKLTSQDWNEENAIHSPIWFDFYTVLIDSSLCHFCKGKILEVLLQSDLPDINKPASSGMCLIHYITNAKLCHKYLEIFLRNSDNKIDLYVEKEKSLEKGLSALTTFVIRKRVTGLQMMLKKGVDINLRSNCIKKYYPLHQAIVLLDEKRVKLFLQKGANINQQGRIAVKHWINKNCSYFPIQLMFCENDYIMDSSTNEQDERKGNILKLLLKENPDILYQKHIHCDQDYRCGSIQARRNCTCSSWFHRLANAAGLPGFLSVEKMHSMTDMSLISFCRKTVRMRLIECNPHKTIYNSISHLLLPQIINNYLLYNESFDIEKKKKSV